MNSAVFSTPTQSISKLSERPDTIHINERRVMMMAIRTGLIWIGKALWWTIKAYIKFAIWCFKILLLIMTFGMIRYVFG